MSRKTDTTTKDEGAWGTLEELLLACAVSRHGAKRWDSIAMELRKRSTNLETFSPQNCRRKYYDLRQRFVDGGDESQMNGDAVVDMVDELKKVRVAELRREVQERGVSIVSLQSKVKRLEEERERSLEEEEGGGVDLEEDRKDGADAGDERSLPEKYAGKSVSGEDSGRGDGSFNASNSTNQKCEDRGTGVEDAQPKSEPAENTIKTDPVQTGSKPTADWSFGGGGVTSPQDPAGNLPESDELWETTTAMEAEAESKRVEEEAAKRNSDVRGSAGQLRRRRKRRRRGGVPVVSSSGEEPEPDDFSPATNLPPAVKSQPLVRLLGMIRSHRHASAFERRLRSQDTGRYRKLVRQHMDLVTVQSRLDRGLYSDCFHKFFRDVLVIFNNGVVFFRNNSPELLAARDLRTLVSKEMGQIIDGQILKAQSGSHQPDPEQRPNSLLKKPNSRASPASSSAAAVFRKRGSSGPAKTPPPPRKGANRKADRSRNQLNPSDVSNPRKVVEERGTVKKTTVSVERLVSGKRSQRKRSVAEGIKREISSGETSSSGEDSEPPNKANKKERVAASAEAARKKKQGVAEFLKRMKEKSPSEKAKGLRNNNSNSNSNSYNDEEEEGKREGIRERSARRVSASKAAAERKQTDSGNNNVKRGAGRPPKRPTPVSSPAKKGRENVGSGTADGATGRPNKRSRR